MDKERESLFIYETGSLIDEKLHYLNLFKIQANKI